jgi:invasion protein IalB
MFLNREQKDRPLRQILCSAATAVALLGLAAGGAIAQQSDQPAAGAAKNADEQKGSAWIKLCTTDDKTKKQQCLVTQELRDGNSGELLASGSVRVAEGEKTLLILAVPIGVFLPPGVRIQIDTNKPTIAPYTICFPHACVVRLEIDDDYLSNMKRGSQMTVSVLNAERKALGFPLTLVGFTKAFEGPPVDPELYKQAEQKLTEEIKRRAEEARKKQEQEQAKPPQ